MLDSDYVLSDAQIVDANGNESSENSEQLVDLLKKWTSIIDKKGLILIDDYLFKDPLIDKMKPTSSYSYILGLELALDYSINSWKQIIDKKKLNDKDVPLEDFPLNIQNKMEFLQNLKENKKIIKERNPPLQLHKCQFCDFKAETLVILDQHLTQPHFYSTIFKCNFCEQFRSHSKEEYKTHLFKIHNRICNIEKPLCSASCSKCNFECGNDFDKLMKHEKFMCQFKTDEISDVNPLNNLLAPTKFDFLEYEYLFNEKPIETNISNSKFLDISSYLPVFSSTQPWLIETYLNKQSKIIEELIIEDNTDLCKEKPTIISVTKPQSILNGLSKDQSINVNKLHKQDDKAVNKPNKDLIISIEASNHYKCHICSLKFLGEFRVKSLIDHLRIVHQILDKASIQEHILPQINSNKTSIQIAPTTIISPITSPVISLQSSHISSCKPSQNPTIIRLLNNNSCNKNSTISFKIEKEFINETLKKNKSELTLFNKSSTETNDDLLNKMTELKIISGRCFRCDFLKIEVNLLSHLNEVHSLDVGQITSDLNCLFCGIHCINRDNLVIHQMNMHNAISFKSTNKLYTISNITSNNNINLEPNSTQNSSGLAKLFNKAIDNESMKNTIPILQPIKECFPIPKLPPIPLLNLITSPLIVKADNSLIVPNNEHLNSESVIKAATICCDSTKKPELISPKRISKEKASEITEKVFSPQSFTVKEHLENGKKLSIKLDKEKISKILKKKTTEELKPVFNPQHDKMIQSFDNLYKSDNKQSKKRKFISEIENSRIQEVEQKHNGIKKKKLEYNCLKCYISFNDFDRYKNHLMESHKLLKEQNSPHGALNLKILPNTTNEKFEQKCYFCLIKFKSRSKYQTHLQTYHMKNATVALNKVDPNKIRITKKKLSNSINERRKNHRLLNS